MKFLIFYAGTVVGCVIGFFVAAVLQAEEECDEWDDF